MADIGRTILYGLIVAVPAIVLGGPVFASTLKKYNPTPLKSLFSDKRFSETEMPSLGISIFTALLPVLLLAGAALFKLFLAADNALMPFIDFIGDPIIAMIITILVAIYTLGIGRGKSMKEVSTSLQYAVKDIALILLIIAGAGALKEMLVVSQVSLYIGELLQNVKYLTTYFGLGHCFFDSFLCGLCDRSWPNQCRYSSSFDSIDRCGP